MATYSDEIRAAETMERLGDYSAALWHAKAALALAQQKHTKEIRTKTFKGAQMLIDTARELIRRIESHEN